MQKFLLSKITCWYATKLGNSSIIKCLLKSKIASWFWSQTTFTYCAI